MSSGFLLGFVNNTNRKVTLSCSVASTADWDSDDARPDTVVKGGGPNALLEVDGFAASPHFHLEVHNNRATAPFTITANFEGSQGGFVFTADGCDGIGPKNDRMFHSAKFDAIQVTVARDQWNIMTIFLTPAVEMTSWMGDLNTRAKAKGKTLTLPEITMPGTHDSGTAGGTAEEGTQCQTMTIEAQLNAGIRYIDLRFRLDDGADDLGIFHGHYFQKLWFKKEVLPVVTRFLATNSSECVVISMNNAVDGDPSYDTLLSEILKGNPEKQIPAGIQPDKLIDAKNVSAADLTLDKVKGCVVLLRRDLASTFGIDISAWPDNPPYTTFSAGQVPVYLQDAYKTAYADVEGKFELVKTHLDLAAGQPNGWFINFSSASNAIPALPWFPWGYATGIGTGKWGVNNRLAWDLIVRMSGGRLGTIVMDYPEHPGSNLLSQLVVAMNSKLV